MPAIPFESYVSSLGRLTSVVDPTISTPAAEDIKLAARRLGSLTEITADTIAAWCLADPQQVYVLALVVGLSREKLTNQLRDWFGTGSWAKAAKEHTQDLVRRMDEDYDLLRLVKTQRFRDYRFEDILIARAGTRTTATSAGQSGRRIEDEIEAVAVDIGLPHALRGRFEGRRGKTAPADLAVPTTGRECVIAVAAKGFDSTGSKLTDAVREIEEMADARTGGQVVLAVVDGIGWRGRMADLKRIWDLWDTNEIDGLYTLATLDQFRADLDHYATLRNIARSS